MAQTNEAMLTLILFGFLSQLSYAGSSLRGVVSATESVSIEEVQRSLLEEINEALNISDAKQATRVMEFQRELSSMFEALPKNDKGSIEHATVHYALHRLFIERHGWSFKGLEPSGIAQTSTTPAGILKDRVPAYIQELFEEQLGGQGFALQELAVLAATLEHLVNNEAQEKLREAFQLLNLLPLQEKLSKEQFWDALDVYMVAQVTKSNISTLTMEEFAVMKEKASIIFPDLSEAQNVVWEKAVISDGGMDLGAASAMVSEAGKYLGLWHKGQCQSKKERLISQGDQQVGRVPLSSFYAAALSGSDEQLSRQTNHIDYLRELGALDESKTQRPSVLVPNYVNSRANCFAASSFYSVCCPNECESLMRHLESGIRAPTAKPDAIWKLVANLPSSVVGASHELPHQLLERLEEISAKHNGKVPIHGRLFAQWLHHAYPRDCPYPHAKGTTRPQTADEWIAETGKESSHTREEMEQFVKTAAEFEVTDDGDITNAVVLPWSDDEELLVVRPDSWSELSVMEVHTLADSERQQPLSVIRYIVFGLALSMMSWLIKEQIAGLIGIGRSATDKDFKAGRFQQDAFENHKK
jgi:hypothetical protein